MKFLSLLILPILIFSNGAQRENQPQKTVNSFYGEVVNFDQFLEKIPSYDLPASMSCDFDRLAAEINFEGCERYFPEGGRVVAKLPSDTEFRFVIFDFPCDYSCPTLFSYSKDGKRLDSLNLTPGQCLEDTGMVKKEWFKIDENIHVELIDTTHYYSYIDNK